ncbi:MAG: stage II sporulation protein R [Clostridia bacterium]|nr:stage II sporulation protein R [Clostridia bacterium]
MLKKALITFFIALLLFPANIWGSEQDYFGNNLVRLHVIANSDKEEDQVLKLIIRDEVLKELRPLQQINSPQKAQKYIWENIIILEERLNRKIKEMGFSYSVNIQFGQYSFPTRKYHDMVLPAGRYLALKVVIGEGKGSNWWCVLFPPICHGDWVREPAKRMVEEENTITVMADMGERAETNLSLKEFSREYFSLLRGVWSFSKSL